tara:strand:- start:7 stop:930 length:924 start_codon:yes stop_codon:yes gene_type:complete
VKIKIGIIGSEGFVGRELVKKLILDKDNDVFCFGKEVKSTAKHLNYQKINLNDISKNKLIFEKMDLIYYLASASIPASSYERPLKDVKLNLLPFLNFLEAISFTKVKKIIFTSSGGTVYGPSKSMLNEQALKNPTSPHGIIKLTMEHFLTYFLNKTGINYDIFRISNIFGERQNTDKGLGLINTVIEKAILKKEIEIFGDGSFNRNYVYVKDVASALSLVTNEDYFSSNIYNLSTSKFHSVNEIIDIVQSLISEPINIKYVKSRKSDSYSSLIDNRKFIEKYPNFSFTDLSDGIKNTYEHLKQEIDD